MPRLLRRVSIPLAGLVLVLFFVYLGFPYGPLASRVAAEAGRALAARVDIREVGPHVGLAGPGFEARGVRVTWPGSAPLEIERVALRPAWSLAWLRGDPAIHAELEGAAGSLEGVWRPSGAWEGEVRELDLSAVPLERMLPGLAPQGRLEARVDLSWRDAAPQGAVAFEATGGSLLLPDVPMPLPYARCRGELVFGNGALLSVESFALEGPLLSASASGRLGEAERFASAPLQLELQLSAVQPALHPLLRSAGVSVDRQGSASLRLTGTPGAPQLRQRAAR